MLGLHKAGKRRIKQYSGTPRASLKFAHYSLDAQKEQFIMFYEEPHFAFDPLFLWLKIKHILFIIRNPKIWWWNLMMNGNFVSC